MAAAYVKLKATNNYKSRMENYLEINNRVQIKQNKFSPKFYI